MKQKCAPFVKAIIYADIFDFPLTKDELWLYAIHNKAIKKDALAAFVSQLPKEIRCTKNYYHLAGREGIVQKRIQRLQVGKRKLLFAEKAARLLIKIPTIRFIGISGGLSVMNASEEDDIDLFIITDHNTVWTTRLMVFVLLAVKGVRRKRNDSSVKNTICVNMYLDENSLVFLKNRHDLYTAHEILQLKPLADKKNTYEQFMAANAWIYRFLPNAVRHGAISSKTETSLSIVLRTIQHNSAVEQAAKLFQLWYMRKHRTKEVVSDTILAFHPIDYRGRTLKTFGERIRQYEEI